MTTHASNDVLELASGQILAILAPHAGRSLMLETAARFSLRGPVRVLDGGNHFNAYIVARSIRRFTADIDSGADTHQPGTRVHLLPDGSAAIRRSDAGSASTPAGAAARDPGFRPAGHLL